MKKLLIAGCGYVGRRLLAKTGADVAALVRSQASADLLSAQGVAIYRHDLDAGSGAFGSPAQVVYLLPPPAQGSSDPRMAAFLASMPDMVERLVLLSTTGVYGDCDGAWVDESRRPAPDTDRGRRRLHAESKARDWCAATGTELYILRVPGIYGPARLPEKRLREGTPVLAAADSGWSNRIHVDDLVACLQAAIAGHGEAGIYNVSDGTPSTMTDYFNRVADALGLARPPSIRIAEARQRFSAGMLSYLAESKRIDNRRMREVLGVVPMYADLDRGLAACVSGSGAA